MSENTLGNGYGGSNFSVFGSAPPSVTLGGGAYYYPGASVTAAGTDWSTGSGNVVPKWDDGSTLDAVGAALGAGSFSGYTFSLPSSASNGSHSISFIRSSGATIDVPVTKVPGPTGTRATVRFPWVTMIQPWMFWRIALPGLRPRTRKVTPAGLRSTAALVSRIRGWRGPGTRTTTPTA